MISLVTTRFNNETWGENYEFRTTRNINGCIYGSPFQLSSNINNNDIVFVIEMNNATNLIEGIGLIRNISHSDEYCPIHNDYNYNRYIYKSKYRLDRNDIINQDKMTLLNIIEYIVFYEKNHLKRGTGFTILNQELIKKKHNANIKRININNLIQMIKKMFKILFTDNINNVNTPN